MNYYRITGLLFFCTLIVANMAIAQRKQDSRNGAKWFGRSTEGILLFPDSTFMLFGYATLIPGVYTAEKDMLHFSPAKLPLFTVHGHHNPQLQDSCRILFSGFEEGNTLVKLDDEPMLRVFNKEANCFSDPYVYEKKNIPTKINLVHVPYAPFNDDAATNEWQYPNSNNYNELVFAFVKQAQEWKDFFAKISVINGVEIFSMYSDDYNDGWKDITASIDKENWDEMMEIKQNVKDYFGRGLDTLFLNKYFVSSNKIEGFSHYKFDTTTNQWHIKHKDRNEEWYESSTSNDFRSVRVFKKMEPEKMQRTTSKYEGDFPELFFLECNNEKSYRYKGLPQPKENHRRDSTSIIAPQPIQ